MSTVIDISVSVVTYKNDFSMLDKLFVSLLNTNLKLQIFIIDNSPDNLIEKICKRKEIVYIFNNMNIGFGAGHNIAIKKIQNLTKYHLIINPDVYFENGTLEKMHVFMEGNPKIGLLVPKIKDWNGSTLCFCRLLPTPFDLFLRRFGERIALLKPILEKRNKVHELSFTGYNKIMDVPCLNGSFMFVRNEVFKKAGIFDERYFMYLDDIDLTRRIHKHYRVVYYPEAVVFHKHSRGSYKELSLLKYHICSAVKYFNKWGWFFDRERNKINRITLNKLLS